MTEPAFAKATLRLRILGRREDGFHDLDALTVALSDPHDDVAVTVDERPGPDGVRIAVEGPAADGVPASAENLAAQAAAAARPGARISIRLTKRIPAGAGLGGGSADAAAVLRTLRAPTALAAGLGSDVPFCVAGGAAWMRGRGELLEPIDPAPAGYAVLVAVPDFRLATPAVYRAWDDLGGPTARRSAPAPGSLAHLVAQLVNDLEPAAEAVDGRVARWREVIEAVTGHPPVLAGSGSAYLVVVDEGALEPGVAEAWTAGVTARWPGSSLWWARPVTSRP